MQLRPVKDAASLSEREMPDEETYRLDRSVKRGRTQTRYRPEVAGKHCRQMSIERVSSCTLYRKSIQKSGCVSKRRLTGGVRSARGGKSGDGSKILEALPTFQPATVMPHSECQASYTSIGFLVPHCPADTSLHPAARKGAEWSI